MSRVGHLLIETPPAQARRRLPGATNAVNLVIGFVMLGFAPLHAGSATAQFGVSAQVVNSCKVSADALALQAASANGTINVNCQNNTTPVNSSSGTEGVGSARQSGTVNVNYSVVEAQGSEGSLKIITVNF